jgi:DNA end-binding protein Ku
MVVSMKALWKGYITLGQLGIPVRLYAATRDSGVRFVQLHETDGSPVERPLFCKKEHREIAASEVVRGVETEPGRYVLFTDQELERGHDSDVKTIEIRQFCEPVQLPLGYFEKPYFIVPASGGEHGYALLREALTRTNMLAVSVFYFYGDDYIGAIQVSEDVLMLHRLRFSDELVPRSNIPTPALPRSDPNEVDMLRRVIERHSGPLHLRDYHDAYAERIRLLTDRKAKGLSMPKAERPAAHATPEDEIGSVLAQIEDRRTALGSGTFG